MARLPCVVIPGVAHHVTQRGNGQQPFIEEGDYALYLDLLADCAERAQAEVRSYFLMPNHVRAALTPSDADGVERTSGEMYERYTDDINARRAPAVTWVRPAWIGGDER